MAKIDFVFFDAGGGHRSAATALKTVCDDQGRGWDIRLVNLQEVLEPLDIFKKITGIRLQDLYNRILENGWTLGSKHLLSTVHAVLRFYHSAQVKMLSAFWSERRPDLVVSLVPNFNRSMFEGLKEACPQSPYVTVITDFADYPPNFWMENQDQYVICGTAKAVQQARAMSYRPERILQTSGMVLRPTFYREFVQDRTDERVKLQLEPDRPTGLILFGGHGSPIMANIADSLQSCKCTLQLIAISGKNEKLAARLRAMNLSFPLHVVGFTSEVPYYMWLSDFFIGKPGPGSISEAVAMNLPVIIERNAWTLPQERYNADWVRETGTGVVVDSFRDIAHAVNELLSADNFRRYRTNVESIRNRAVFEIPEMLEKILEKR